ncbi:uncharacterized protein KQ657_001503 [Scheffersomyces spartinae]|uniref:Uncharacterized protein n=1 Tax=Scheffersomyces spartinae TaxID=45513 RepID=A0A9P7V7M2_9ASCO|nr:uncharacterized protein KQ657_001503 [Scheffersomyces spartinae]KAG7192720.1 hypothetical protein KQ657_001503 [Scheffersomyces spartinae]
MSRLYPFGSNPGSGRNSIYSQSGYYNAVNSRRGSYTHTRDESQVSYDFGAGSKDRREGTGTVTDDVLSLTSTLDRIRTAKPNATYADNLWTQIDVLDDVKHMSDEVRSKGTFFNDKFTEELAQLKKTQNRLIETMIAENDKGIDLTGSSRPAGVPATGDINADSGDNIEDFFNGNLREQQELLHRRHNFDGIKRFVDDVEDHLASVGKAMREFDDSTKDHW